MFFDRYKREPEVGLPFSPSTVAYKLRAKMGLLESKPETWVVDRGNIYPLSEGKIRPTDAHLALGFLRKIR